MDGGSDALFSVGGISNLAAEIAVVSAGGLVVGLAAGTAVYNIMRNLDEHMTEIVLTIILAYGSFLLAEHYLHVSGVIATVVAGLLIDNRGAEHAMSPKTKVSVFDAWETGAFIVNTFIFLLIGVKTPIGDLVDNALLIVIAIVLTLVARAISVYLMTNVANLVTEPDVPVSYQHVMLWGGLHASIPIALVLGLPEGTPQLSTLRALVFGVAAFSLVVQGLTMSTLLNRLGIVTRSDAEELYELLVGRARAVDAALEAADRLHEQGDIPAEVYTDFTAEYEREKVDLEETISTLLSENPQLRQEQLLGAERQLLQREKSAIMDAVQAGVVSDDVADRLLEEVNLKLDHVHDGRSTVQRREEGFEEFWRSRANDFGLTAGELPGERESDTD